jgi:hypothetical protein
MSSANSDKEKKRGPVSQTKVQEEELASLKSLRAMLTSLNEAAIKIHEDISTSIANQRLIQGKSSPEIDMH